MVAPPPEEPPPPPPPVLHLPWECQSCYADNHAHETHCAVCGVARGDENPPEEDPGERVSQ